MNAGTTRVALICLTVLLGICLWQWANVRRFEAMIEAGYEQHYRGWVKVKDEPPRHDHYATK